jgi:hypothetical protein
MDQQNKPLYEVVWPRSSRAIEPQPLAPRLDTLAGKRIGFLWDYLFRGETLFPAIEQALNEAYDGIECVGWETFGNTHGGDEAAIIGALPERLAANRVDAVISGVGC